MADNKVLGVSKGVARGHIMCCCAVVFVCFMLTCINLYMMSSTRAVLRHLDARLDAHPRSLQRQQQLPTLQTPDEAAAAAMLQQALQAPDVADDFILLAPSDLDNAWTTQTGRLLVPVGQPDQEDDGWKQMQVQLAEQTSAQQRHIENLHDKLADQYRAREELQRSQHSLLREHHKLSMEHQQQLAKKERQLLKEKHRAIKQGAKHSDELHRVKSEVEELKKVLEDVKSLDPEQNKADQQVPAVVAQLGAAMDAALQQSPETTVMPVLDNQVFLLQQQQQQLASSPAAGEPTPEPVKEAVVLASAPKEVDSSLEHIFSAVFGPNPGAYFFPSYSVVADGAGGKAAEASPASPGSSRQRRDLAELQQRRERRRAALATRMGIRRRRHYEASGPLMRIDGGQRVPLYDTPAVVLRDEEGALRAARRRRLSRG